MGILNTEALLERMRLLVVAPHADDEILGAGGLMARIKEAGGEVYVIVASVGDLDHFDNDDGEVASSVRMNELQDAMELLEVDDFEVLFTDRESHLRLETFPRKDLVNEIEREAELATEKTKPNAICLPAPSYNQDHEAMYRAGMTACRPHLSTLKDFQQLVLVADAPQLSWNPGHDPFNPDFYVDISGKYLKKKIDALRCHESQMRPDPHQGGVESVRLLAQTRGREISVEAAEAFECRRLVL